MTQFSPPQSRFQRISFALFMFIGFMIFVSVAWHWKDMNDFAIHNNYIVNLLEGSGERTITVVHFLYHLIVGALAFILPFLEVSSWGAVVIALTKVSVGIITVLWINHTVNLDSNRLWVGALLAGLGMMIVAPIIFISPDTYYFGYFSPHVYHNPTTPLMHPFGLVSFIFAIYIFTRRIPPARQSKWYARLMLLNVLSILAKPSFMIILLPSLALLTLYRMVKREFIPWRVLLLGIVIPSGGLILIQTFGLNADAQRNMIIAPLELFAAWARSFDPQADELLGLKFFASIAFPLVVYLVYWRKTSKELIFNMAWVMMAVASAYAYLIVHEGRTVTGDFVWSAQFAVLLLFMVATRFLFQQINDSEKWKLWVTWAIFAIHVVAGIFWYWMHFIQAQDPTAPILFW